MEAYTFKITNLMPPWITVVSEMVSSRAYDLDLKSKIKYEFAQNRTTVSITFDGSPASCVDLEDYITRLVDYVNSQPVQA